MRLVITFDDSLFPSLADFYPAEYGASVRGGSDLAAPGEGGVRHRVYVEPFNSAARIETHRSPEGVKQVSFFTQANPGAAVDSAIAFAIEIAPAYPIDHLRLTFLHDRHAAVTETRIEAIDG